MTADELYELNRQMDQAKSNVFLDKRAAFLGSLMCSVDHTWKEDTDTAETDGVRISWNPAFFQAIPPKARITVMVHELWHIARLHPIRCMGRDPETWNQACDIRINNDLEREGYSFDGIENCWKDASFDRERILSEDEIYEILIQNPQKKPKGAPFSAPSDGNTEPEEGQGDLCKAAKESKQKIINSVVQAVQQAKLSNSAGTVPGSIQEQLNKFLDPIIPWQTALMDFFVDLDEKDYSWRKPNRRFDDIYLPSLLEDEGRLEHLMYFLDVSGSVTQKQVIRFNSEVKYIQEELKPKRLTLVQFDHQIQKVDEFEEDQPFDGIKIVGRGGTSLEPVREMIIEQQPTAAIIFSDLYCEPMSPLPFDVPVIWVVIGNKRGLPAFGHKTIHID